MYIYNSKLFYISTLIIIFIFSVSILNKNSENILQKNKTLIGDLPVEASLNKELIPLIINLNENSKSSLIQKSLLTSPSVINNTYVNKNNDSLSNYLINIFCSEINGKYVKVASGSGIFLSNPNEKNGIILTNAHVARHLLDSNKKCVGRTGSPTKTTHTLTLRYIPYFWLDKNKEYIIGDTNQNSTGEFDFAIIESTSIDDLEKDSSNIYTALQPSLKLKISDYEDESILNNIYIYSYPAQQILSKNVYNPLFQKKDLVTISNVYNSPSQNIKDSLIDVTGSVYIDHGSSGGMVISQGQSNSLIGLSSILIKNTDSQIVRVVTMKHIISILENELKNIDNQQIDPFIIIINDILSKKDVDMSFIQILKNIKLTSLLEQYTKDTLIRLNIIN